MHLTHKFKANYFFIQYMYKINSRNRFSQFEFNLFLLPESKVFRKLNRYTLISSIDFMIGSKKCQKIHFIAAIG